MTSELKLTQSDQTSVFTRQIMVPGPQTICIQSIFIYWNKLFEPDMEIVRPTLLDEAKPSYVSRHLVHI